MEGSAGAAMWAVLGVPVLVVVVGSVVRPVLAGRLVLVVRRDVVRRVARRGLAVRTPLVDRFVTLDVGPNQLLAAVRATTADEHEVLVLLEAGWRAVPVSPGAAYAPPSAALEAALEAEVRAAVRGLGVPQLPEALATHLAERRGAVRVPGVELVDLDLAEVEVLLRPATGSDGSR